MKNKTKSIWIAIVVFSLFAPLRISLAVSTSSAQPQALTLSQAELKMSRIPIREGLALASQEIEIFNNTEKDIRIGRIVVSCPCLGIEMPEKLVRKKSKSKIAVNLRLNSRDINERKIQAYFVPEEKSLDPLLLVVTGSSDFMAYTDLEVINFGTMEKGVTKTREIGVFLPGEKEEHDFIKKLSLTNEKLFSASILETGRTKKINGGSPYYLNSITVQVRLEMKEKPQATQDVLKVECANGNVLTIPIGWYFYEKPVFEPNVKSYLLIDLQPGEARTFQVVYNEDVGGDFAGIKIRGSGLSLSGMTRKGAGVRIELKYLAPEKIRDGKVAALEVETKSGKNHFLDVIADVQAPDAMRVRTE
ncbi:MAG: hypothetical protein LBD14_05560 [Puniceicoccales bacterium]|jgi:hypothetical protein|nr:hypothetical protein [Puniceicoccales bacterium]